MPRSLCCRRSSTSVPDRLGRLGVQRDGALAQRLAGGQAQPVGAVGVAVEAVQVQAADLAAAGSAPPGDQQRAALQRAVQRPDRSHDRLELMLGDVAGNPLHDTGYVGVEQHRPGRHVGPFGVRGVPEEDGDLGDDAALVGVAERLVGLLDLALVLQPGHEIQQVGAGQLGQALRCGALFVEPDAEAAHPPRVADMVSGRTVSARSAQVAAHHRGDAGLAAQRRWRLGWRAGLAAGR